MKKLYALLFLVLSATAFSQQNFRYIDSVLAIYNKPNTPGVSVHIVKDGNTLYSKQAGMADIEKKKLLNDKSVFHLASASKQFTGSCIVMLQQQGKLSLDDKLSQYFPDFPDYANKVTLSDLLNHSSGIKDIDLLAYLQGGSDIDLTDETTKALLIRFEPDFEPGTKHSYSNSGYWFLAQIVKKVSGKNIKEFAAENIFKPLKMRSTLYVDSPNATFKNKVRGYEMKDGKPIATIPDGHTISGAGVYSTVGDLQKWLEEMTSKKILGDAFWNKMLNVDEETFYNNGLEFTDVEGHKKVYHGGDNEGFHTSIACLPKDRLSVIVLSNNDEVDASAINADITNLMLGLPVEAPEAIQPAVAVLSDAALDQYSGIYKKDKAVFLIGHTGGQVYVKQVYNEFTYGLEFKADNTFNYNGLTFTFDDISNGKAQKLAITQDGSLTVFPRAAVSQEELSSIAGSYYSKGLDTTYRFFVENGILKYKMDNRDASDVDYVFNDKAYADIGTLRFKRNEAGVITGFSLDHPRANNLEFVKG